ncbi:flagellar biosynthesis protein FlgA [halophilic archaeon]|nr:flagellar biosynthesis protein FlgA [halophilic archaeon]
MLNVPAKLHQLEQPIRVGVIGAGVFGTKLIDQLERAPGMTTAVVADVDEQKAVDAYVEAGISSDAVVDANSAAEADIAVADGNRAILTDGVELTATEVDVVVEATGVPEVGARHAYEAIMAKKHVVMVTVEADTVVGPILAEFADNNDVTYTMAYGDQPSLIVELYHWAETVGLDVVAAGKGNPFREEYRHGTPDDVFKRFGYDASFVEEQDLNARMYNSFLDGTKVAVEMCAVANATGLTPDTPGMHLPTAEIPEIPELLRPTDDGGILDSRGSVDTISTLQPDGSAVSDDISFGVFLVTTTPNEQVQTYLKQNAGTGLHVASDGKYQLFYRPYHLPGVETPVSVANAALRNEATGVPHRHEAEVVGAAKRNLTPGDELDGGGGYTVYGLLETAETAAEQNHVPFELLKGATVRQPIETDDVVTYDDVEINDDSFLHHLRHIQDRH